MENFFQEKKNYLKITGFIWYLAKIKRLGDFYGREALVGMILITWGLSLPLTPPDYVADNGLHTFYEQNIFVRMLSRILDRGLKSQKIKNIQRKWWGLANFILKLAMAEVQFSIIFKKKLLLVLEIYPRAWSKTQITRLFITHSFFYKNIEYPDKPSEFSEFSLF